MHDAPSTFSSSPTRPQDTSHSTAIILGAGGAAGWSFHIGAADALAEAGVPLEGAPRVIGTSAGAAVSACLLAGTSRDGLLDHLMIAPPPEERERAMEAIRERRRFPPRFLTPTSVSLLRYALPGRFSPGRAATALVPRGVLPTRPLGLFPGLRGSAWPETLWIPAIRLPGGERVVFGRDHTASLADAVEASQSVPMMFAPKRIDGHDHIDAATVSSTHADLLIGAGIDRAIIVAPMIRPGAGIWRGIVRRALDDEHEQLSAAGIRVEIVTPGAELEDLFSGIRGRGPSAAPLMRERARRRVAQVLDGSPLIP